jgi:hypothetical protein
VSGYENRLQALCNMLVDSGDMTPMGARKLRQVMVAERQYGTALLLDEDNLTFMDPQPHSKGLEAAKAVVGETRGGWPVVPIFRVPSSDWELDVRLLRGGDPTW